MAVPDLTCTGDQMMGRPALMIISEEAQATSADYKVKTC